MANIEIDYYLLYYNGFEDFFLVKINSEHNLNKIERIPTFSAQNNHVNTQKFGHVYPDYS